MAQRYLDAAAKIAMIIATGLQVILEIRALIH
jgi:hypothetical protein